MSLENDINHEYDQILQSVIQQAFGDKLSESTIHLWFDDLKITSFENDNIILSSGSTLKFQVIKNKYLNTLTEAFSTVLGFPITLNIIFSGQATQNDTIIDNIEKENNITNIDKKDIGNTFTNYKFEYTFDNFIVGSTNKFAQAACMGVAENPASRWNPLFIYGNSGLGKTHLLHATINKMLENNPKIRIIYANGEDFTNQLISSMSNKTVEEFREKFRHCDVLLIDDIQFIAGKRSTQEEFFHTFNALHDEKKQIILTSDRPPRDIQFLEERLKTRFEWGLLADIEPPDIELRIAIIKNKAEQIHIHPSNEVLNYLGENLRFNVRQIEGAIKKLGALSFLNGNDEITMEMAKNCISDLIIQHPSTDAIVDSIFNEIEKKYNISKSNIQSTKRDKDIANARHIAIYLMRSLTDLSFPSISKIVNRDHSTILSSFNLIENKIKESKMFASEINQLKDNIASN